MYTMPPVSGFWRRLSAFLIDGLALGVFLQIIALPLSFLWFEFGPYGRIVGFLIALGYFGVLDSRAGGGQTLGKRLMKVAVRGADGQPIDEGVSVVRTLIWLVPASINGWAIPLMHHPVAAWVASFLIFGVGGAVVVTLVFNRRSRQGVHDLLTRSYVVRLNGQPVESLPSATRLPWILSGAVLLVTLISGVLLAMLNPGGQFEYMRDVHQELLADDRFFSASVMDRTYFQGGEETSHVLVVNVWYKGKPTDAERRSAVNDVVRAALTMDEIDDFEGIIVSVTSAYDLGLASYQTFSVEDESVETWRERLGVD